MSIVNHDIELKPFWAKYFRFDWKLGFTLICLICIPRFILVLHANATGNYNLIGGIMVLSALAPYVFLSKTGRRGIGMLKTRKYGTVCIAFFIGIAVSLLLYYLGNLLYGLSYKNWYVYIAKSYKIPAGITGAGKMTMFLIMALVGMTFSPVGEELFFRGIVQGSFAKSLGEKRALIIDCLAFAVTHIAHFGLVFINNRFNLLIVPTLIWVAVMFLTSMLFYFYKKKSGSLLGAMVCHSGFNLGMIFSIFYLL